MENHFEIISKRSGNTPRLFLDAPREYFKKIKKLSEIFFGHRETV